MKMAKKKTKKKVAKKTLKATKSNTIKNCTISGVTIHWDADGVEAIVAIAKALEQNAVGLTVLARAIDSEGISTGPIVSIE